MHLKLSLEKKSISMNLGSMIEREEKRFVYRIRCFSDENNAEEEMEEGIGDVSSRRRLVKKKLTTIEGEGEKKHEILCLK